MRKVESVIIKAPEEAIRDLRLMGEASCQESLARELARYGWKVMPCHGVGFLAFKKRGGRYYWSGLAERTGWETMLLIIKHGGLGVENVQ